MKAVDSRICKGSTFGCFLIKRRMNWHTSFLYLSGFLQNKRVRNYAREIRLTPEWINRRKNSAYFVIIIKKGLNRRRDSAYLLEKFKNVRFCFVITGKPSLIYHETSAILKITGKSPFILFLLVNQLDKG